MNCFLLLLQVNRSKAAVEADLRTLILRLDWEGSLGTRLCVSPFTAGSRVPDFFWPDISERYPKIPKNVV